MDLRGCSKRFKQECSNKSPVGPIFKEEKLRIKKFKEEYREYKKKGGEEPVRDRLIVSDVTPEGLYQVLADKDNTKAGLLLYRDEIKGFLDDMNRYNSEWVSVIS